MAQGFDCSQSQSGIAAKMLENYLAGSSKTEEAPVFIAHIRLARLKQQLGDAAGAQQSLQLPGDGAQYNPAQDSDLDARM